MRVLKIVLLVFAGLVSVVATEGGVFASLAYAPGSLDLAGNYFTMTILPVVVLVIVLVALLLWKMLAANPARNCLIFSTVYIVAEAGGLLQLGNPVGVVAMYGVVWLACVGSFCCFHASRLDKGRSIDCALIAEIVRAHLPEGAKVSAALMHQGHLVGPLRRVVRQRPDGERFHSWVCSRIVPEHRGI